MINGYALADEMFNKIGENEEHELSIEDVLRVISFWGFNEEVSVNSRIGFVCYCARTKFKKVFEQALVYGDFSLYEELETHMERRKTESGVPNFESEKYVKERIKNYSKLLKSGILDCVKETK